MWYGSLGSLKPAGRPGGFSRSKSPICAKYGASPGPPRAYPRLYMACADDSMKAAVDSALTGWLVAPVGRQPSTAVGSVSHNCRVLRTWLSASRVNCPTKSTVVRLVGSQRRLERTE